MDLTTYRQSEAEMQRTRDLMQLAPARGSRALDIGARDGHFSRLLAERFDHVTALDLTQPSIAGLNIECVAGDITGIQFANDAFDFVFCAEVLEHIPPHLLERACAELGRVCRGQLLIGVPYRQDIRCGRTTCRSCGRTNPPWGHVNSFDEDRIKKLFPLFAFEKISFVGMTNGVTNALAVRLMDLAGNPYGTYEQDEPCVHCGQKVERPPARTFAQRLFTRSAFYLNQMQRRLTKPHPNWMHALLSKPGA